MEFGQFEIFQFNGKDCFIKAPDERFTLLSFCEIPDGMHRYLKPGKKLEKIGDDIVRACEWDSFLKDEKDPSVSGSGPQAVNARRGGD